MKYLSKSFSTPANSRAYVDNWDAVFGDKCECRSAYDCAWPGCDEHRCMECNELCSTENTKTAVRWCPEHRERGVLGMG